MLNFQFFNSINLLLLALIAIRIFWSDNEKIINIVIFTSLFSAISALQYIILNAPDVAITEVSIGACLSTIFILKASASVSKNGRSQPRFEESSDKLINKVLFILVVISFFIFFYKASLHFPKIISDELPLIYNDTIKYYINQTRDFLGFSNIVTAVIVSFRGYDTLIETVVILTAGIAILAILPKDEVDLVVKKSPLCDKSVITNVVIMIIPFIVIFAFYIQAHGEESPGGGFQSGSILASAIIGYSLAISETAIVKYLRNSLLLRIGATGVLMYSSVGLIPMLKNKEFLNHNYFLCSVDSIDLLCFSKSQKMGIFFAELGVGMTVFAVMTLIFFNLKGKNNDI